MLVTTLYHKKNQFKMENRPEHKDYNNEAIRIK